MPIFTTAVAARNFSIEQATCDFIYTADADEVIDDENRERFKAAVAAWRAWSAFCFTWCDTSLIAADNSCTELACSVEPCASACAPEETCSEPENTRSEETLI